MKRRFGGYIRLVQGTVRVIVVVVLLMLLSRVLGGDGPLRPGGPRKVLVPEAKKEQMARKIAGDYSMGNFKPSLEMKENVDFLLTPALLVQEALSDDIVITYPAE